MAVLGVESEVLSEVPVPFPPSKSDGEAGS